MSSKQIIIGDIEDSITGSPISQLRQAIFLSKQERFTVFTNNAQLIESLEVLCGEQEISIILKIGDNCCEIDFEDAYDYIADIYLILNFMRSGYENKDYLERRMQEYEKKYQEMVQ